MAEVSEFTHVGIRKKTQKQIALLAKVAGMKIYELMEQLVNEEWKKAVKRGLVTDAMLDVDAHWVGEGGKK